MSQHNPEDGTQDLIQQIIQTVTPELLTASHRIDEDVSRSTLAEIESWRDLQELDANEIMKLSASMVPRRNIYTLRTYCLFGNHRAASESPTMGSSK